MDESEIRRLWQQIGNERYAESKRIDAVIVIALVICFLIGMLAAWIR